MTVPALFQWTSASRSDVGLVRERNEDAVLDQPERGLWAVADGMGGHAVGDFASQAVVNALNSLPPPRSLPDYIAGARRQLLEANRLIQAEAVRRRVQRIGSTVVVLLAHDQHCACLWAGDSRIYLYRDGHLHQLTRDHSVAEELRSKRGVAAGNSASHAPRNAITRAVGAAPGLEIDEELLEVRDGDVFLLCSDGLSNLLSADEIAGALAHGNRRDTADALVNLALAHGGRDNVSAVVACAEDLYNSDKTLLNPAL